MSSSSWLTLSSSPQHYSSETPGQPLLLVETELCQAVICLQGAQLLEFQAKGEKPLLWLSSLARFEPGVPIRGGIPVCSPWFGVHTEEPDQAKHGFVRNQLWGLRRYDLLNSGVCQLEFVFATEQRFLDQFPHDFQLSLIMTLGHEIEIEYQVKSFSSEPMPFSWALHSYISIDDLQQVSIQDLDATHYLDATKQFQPTAQVGDVTFNGELDRVYENVDTLQTIIDNNRSLLIRGENCPTAIVWNPGEELAATMDDVGSEGYLEYICLERGAAFNDSWLIQPGEKRIAKMSIQSEKIIDRQSGN